MPFPPRFLALMILLAGLTGLPAQQPSPIADPKSAVPPGPAVQAKIREWVRTKQLISAESSDWEAEKESLARLNEIRREEAAKLEQLITAAGGRLTDAEKELAALRAEKAALTVRRKELETQVESLEAELRNVLPTFPEPLRDKLAEVIVRLDHPSEDANLQERWRDVLLVLGEASRFDHQITIHSEVREIGGQRMEVDVVYLGLAQAWFADRAGRHAGSGIANDQGWTWKEQPALHGRVREVIAMQLKQQVPGFVALPVNPQP